MDLNELVNNYEEDLQSALKADDAAQRTLLILDAFREFKNNVINLVGGNSEYEVEQAPKVDLGMPFGFADSRYVRGKCGWLAASLYKKAEEDGLKPFAVPLASMDLSILPFRCKNMDDFLWHMKRCMAADTNIPIIYDDYGQIADGNHRVARAIIEGHRYIMAYRLKNMPPIDYTEEEKED